MRVKILGPHSIKGSVEAPSSKAYTHRALITSLLSDGTSTIERPLSCDDTDRTLEAIESLGATVSREDETIKVQSTEPRSFPGPRIDCGESGATLRFLTAVSAAFPAETTLVTRGSLLSRPLIPLVDSLRTLGASVELRQQKSTTEIRVRGPLAGGSVPVPGNISSQFVSGLLLAAPLATNDVKIQVTTMLESRPYVDLTLAIMRMHGVEVEVLPNGFFVSAPQSYRRAEHQVPTDLSAAAFLLVAGITAGDELELSKVRESPIEPDYELLHILSEMGVRLERNEDNIKVARTQLEGFKLDASDHPDLVPALEVLACQARGMSEIQGVGRLVHKESDRLRSVPQELGKMGARINLVNDSLVIEGGHALFGRELRSHCDHRVAMACATASLAAQGASIIEDAGVVSKSYPGFYEDLGKLGVDLLVE